MLDFDARKATEAEAHAIGRNIQQYWALHGASVSVRIEKVREGKLTYFYPRAVLGPQGLPTVWKSPRHKQLYLHNIKENMGQLKKYLNCSILPVYREKYEPPHESGGCNSNQEEAIEA